MGNNGEKLSVFCNCRREISEVGKCWEEEEIVRKWSAKKSIYGTDKIK